MRIATAPLLLALLMPAAAHARDATRPARLLLVAFTGVEDAARLAAPFHHAVLVRRSGAAREVAIVVYGRAVAAVVPSVGAVPPSVRTDVQEALTLGVKIYVCERSLEMAGLSAGPLLTGVERVPSGAVKVAELVSEGFVPLQY